jgi:hypothetical protein
VSTTKKPIARGPPKWLIKNKIQSFCKRLYRVPHNLKLKKPLAEAAFSLGWIKFGNSG